MIRFQVIAGPVRIPAGAKIRMTVEQAARRLRLLTALSGGVYLAKAPTEWKTGEIFETDYEFGKEIVGTGRIKPIPPDKPKRQKHGEKSKVSDE